MQNAGRQAAQKPEASVWKLRVSCMAGMQGETWGGGTLAMSLDGEVHRGQLERTS